VRDPCANETKNAFMRRYRLAPKIASEQDFYPNDLTAEGA
jgi:hypothetical protein